MCFAECIRRRHKISLYAVFHCGSEQNTVLALFAYCDIDLPRAAADAVFEIRIFGAEGVFKVGQIVFSYAVSLFVFAKSRFFQAVYYVHLTIDRCNRLFNLFVALEINFVAGYVAFYFLSVARLKNRFMPNRLRRNIKIYIITKISIKRQYARTVSVGLPIISFVIRTPQRARKAAV